MATVPRRTVPGSGCEMAAAGLPQSKLSGPLGALMVLDEGGAGGVTSVPGGTYSNWPVVMLFRSSMQFASVSSSISSPKRSANWKSVSPRWMV